MRSNSAMLEEFAERGFVVVPGAVEPAVVRACVATIAERVREASGVDLDDPATWTQPVVRVNCPETPAFAAAGTAPVLHAAYDALLGAGRWVPRAGVGGTVPVRFPSSDDPGDAGWHVDGSYDVGGEWWSNVRSRDRGLLALFLFSDVGPDDAPTEVIVGSHRDVPPVLAPFGEEGASAATTIAGLPRSTFDRPRAFAIGRAGDVFLCHPFLVHRATWPHRGRHPRILAQPAVALREPFALGAEPTSVVERTIVEALSASR